MQPSLQRVAGVDDEHRVWMERWCALLTELAGQQRVLQEYMQELRSIVHLAYDEREDVLRALEQRTLYLVHRHDQLAAEVRSLAAANARL
jgi:hypothetical protein